MPGRAKLKKFFKDFLMSRKNSLLENIVLCLAVTLTSAFLVYDSYYFFMDILRTVVSVMLFIAWLWCGFLSGRDRKWGFLVFAGVYWLVPYVYMLCYSSRNGRTYYDDVLKLLYRFSDLLFNRSLLRVADFTNCDVYIWVLSLIILTFTMYFVGVNVENILRDRKSSKDT
ncbi:MAG: hypothetical protein J1F04_08660 [Oscillospiraceae bacterium]|nr:hypothetical protein [Oscillospiraceae bacterium]